MKKKLLVILLSVFYSIHLNAQQQYKRCLDSDTVRWSIMAYHQTDMGLTSMEIIASGDTLINDLSYKRLYIDEFNSFDVEETNTNWKNWIPDLHWQWENFYIRESEDASKIYILDANENEEYLISDLDLQVGDDFQFFRYGNGSYTDLVNSVYIKDDLKHIQFAGHLNEDFPQTFIEGTGPTYWFVYIWWLTGYLNCFQNQSIFYKNELSEFLGTCPCGYRSPPDAIESISNKDYLLQIKDDKIEIHFSIPGSRQISIYDVSGRLYYSKDLSSGDDAVIPSGSFPKGIYVLKIFGKDKNQINVSKIIL
jgi:hypothetical protein